jgi:flagellar hook-associated protein 1 FlgK
MGDLNFAGINLSMRGLMAAQEAINTAGHDVANANTEGFSRQTVKIAAASSAFPITLATDPQQASLGAGVDIKQVTRIRDQFLDHQFRDVNLNFGEHETTSSIIKQIEGLFNEPSDSGLAKMMTHFFDAWHELSQNPTEAAVRANLRENGIALANRFNEVGSGLMNLRIEVNDRIKSGVEDVNSTIKQLAELNGQISTALGAKVMPNNLMDQRDLLLDKLSKYADIQLSQRSDGTTWVFVFGKAVVQGDRSQELDLNPNGELTLSTIAFDQEPIHPKDLGGIFKGLFNVRDKIIGRPVVPNGSLLPNTPSGLAFQLDVLANKLAEAVNNVHRMGTTLAQGTGVDFFIKDAGKGVASQYNSEIITASNITVNTVFSDDSGGGLNLIAAGAPPGGTTTAPTFPPSGDNQTALAIAKLRQSQITDGSITSVAENESSQFTAEDFYRNILTTLGVRGQAADKLLKNQKALLEHVENLRQSVSGVNMDEEMANMVKFQHTYAATARMISTFDQMLDRIINGMGQSGR